MKRLPKDATFAWKTAHLILNVGMPLICRLRIRGAENVPDQGGVVIACNHPGGVDVVALGYASPRQIYYMAKSELFAGPRWFSALIHSMGAFPIRRKGQDVAAVGTGVRLLRQGKVLGMFPEGTRNYGKGLRTGKLGAVRIALKSNAPIVPAVVLNIPELNQNLTNPLVRPAVEVRFDEPIYIDGDGDDAEQNRIETDRVMRRVASMLPTEERGVYG